MQVTRGICLALVASVGLAWGGRTRASAVQDGDYEPARLRAGAVPGMPPPATVGRGEVLLEVAVGDDGAVADVTVLRRTPPFTDMVVASVRGWRFDPARLPDEDAAPSDAPEDRLVAAASHVLVGAVFLAPSLLVPTLGDPPADVAAPSDEVPAPVDASWPSPAMPPTAFSAGVALVEGLVDDDGRLAGVTVVRAAPGLESAALDAARAWQFRPARVDRRAVPSRVYLMFGFPLPVVN